MIEPHILQYEVSAFIYCKLF